MTNDTNITTDTTDATNATDATITTDTVQANPPAGLIVGGVVFVIGIIVAILSYSRTIIFPHLTPIGLGIALVGLIVAGYIYYSGREKVQ